MSEKGVRITFKRTRPNPFLQRCLENLLKESRAKKSKLEPMINEALTSLSKYPLRLETGAECAILSGFNKQLCTYLDNCLESSNTNINNCSIDLANNDDQPSTSQNSLSVSSNNADFSMPSCSKETSTSNTESDTASNTESNAVSSIESNTVSSTESNTVSSTESYNVSNTESSTVCNIKPNTKSNNDAIPKRKINSYEPAFKSGGYAVLLGLLEITNSCTEPVKKEKVIEIAQKYSEESFIKPKPGTFYTAWSSVGTLIKKDLVKKTGGKGACYFLTGKGKLLASKLFKEIKSRPTINDLIFNDVSFSNGNNLEKANDLVLSDANVDNCTPNQPQSTTDETQVIDLNAGTFDVILLIDKNETSGLSKKNDPTVAHFKKYPDLMHEYRSLKVGDFTWIARHKVNKDQEVVLPYIVERKRMDDLGASIKDGRFHEQKFRLRKCGLDNVIYMIENYGSNKHVGLPIQSLLQALANTRVQDGFKIHTTNSLTHSTRFLAMMTKRLTIQYKEKHLKGWNQDPRNGCLMTFEYFNKSASKNKALSVTDTFIKLLLQLKGVSVEKALAITNTYKTPASLIEKYKECDRTKGEKLLANLRYNEASKNVGPSVSKAIYQLFAA